MLHQEEYRAFSRQNPQLPIYIKDWYLDSVCHDGEWGAALAWQEESMVGALPYFVKQKAGFSYITMPPFVKMMGPYFTQADLSLTTQHEWLEQLIQQLPKIAAFTQQFHYSATNWLPFFWAGYRQSTRYSYWLSLKEGLEKVEKGMNRNMRRNIAKAENQLRLEFDCPIEIFYKINALSFKRQGLAPPYTLAQLEAHHAALQANKAGKIFSAVDEHNKIHGVAYLIWDNHSAYYHLAGEDPALRQSGAGIWLIWQAIQYTYEQLRLPIFDFEGSMIRPIEAIRRQFGAVQQPYSLVWKYDSRLFKILQMLKGNR